jgi:hypothetical protein
LNKAASEELKFPLDLSRGARRRLKSPMMADGPETEEYMRAREFRKSCFLSWRQDP